MTQDGLDFLVNETQAKQTACPMFGVESEARPGIARKGRHRTGENSWCPGVSCVSPSVGGAAPASPRGAWSRDLRPIPSPPGLLSPFGKLGPDLLSPGLWPLTPCDHSPVNGTRPRDMEPLVPRLPPIHLACSIAVWLVAAVWDRGKGTVRGRRWQVVRGTHGACNLGKCLGAGRPRWRWVGLGKHLRRRPTANEGQVPGLSWDRKPRSLGRNSQFQVIPNCSVFLIISDFPSPGERAERPL